MAKRKSGQGTGIDPTESKKRKSGPKKAGARAAKQPSEDLFSSVSDDEPSGERMERAAGWKWINPESIPNQRQLPAPSPETHLATTTEHSTVEVRTEPVPMVSRPASDGGHTVDDLRFEVTLLALSK